LKVDKDSCPLVCRNPVVLVTTVDANMRLNAITLTLVGAVCGQPPMIGIGKGVEQRSRSLLDEKGGVDLGKVDSILFKLTNSYWGIGKKLADCGYSRSRAGH
jgi:flavin reductase (DIM6/NTAB) family NADH-FMN oxidoreductase RutF